ncbi:MAG: YraN family protein, partial [Sedimentibacter sp.]
MYNNNKGFEYEKIAENFLLHNNFNIIEKNFSCRYGEIDIIAMNNGILHFIEVKGRKNLDHGYPREAVNLAKQKRIIGASKYYFLLKGTDDVFCQFDVVEIILEGNFIN